MTVFFETTRDFRAWMKSNHKKGKPLKIGFRTRPNGHACITIGEATAEAMKFGWTARKRIPIDSVMYAIEFAPCDDKSRWNEGDVALAEKLLESGDMTPAGALAFARRKLVRSKRDEDGASIQLSPLMLTELKRHPAAWRNFQRQSAASRQKSVGWVMSAKQEKTKSERFGKLLMDLSRPQ